MVRKKRGLSYIKKGAIIGGIFGVILVLILNLIFSLNITLPLILKIFLGIFTYIPSLIGMVLFAIQHFIFKGGLFGAPTKSMFYFVYFIIIVFYVLIGMLIAYIIQRRKK